MASRWLTEVCDNTKDNIFNGLLAGIEYLITPTEYKRGASDRLLGIEYPVHGFELEDEVFISLTPITDAQAKQLCAAEAKEKAAKAKAAKEKAEKEKAEREKADMEGDAEWIVIELPDETGMSESKTSSAGAACQRRTVDANNGHRIGMTAPVTLITIMKSHRHICRNAVSL
jgi:hypothetical protein